MLLWLPTSLISWPGADQDQSRTTYAAAMEPGRGLVLLWCVPLLGQRLKPTVTASLLLRTLLARGYGSPPEICLLRCNLKNCLLDLLGHLNLKGFINHSAVQLKLLASLCIHPTFRVSLIKPVQSWPLASVYEGASLLKAGRRGDTESETCHSGP